MWGDHIVCPEWSLKSFSPIKHHILNTSWNLIIPVEHFVLRGLLVVPWVSKRRLWGSYWDQLPNPGLGDVSVCVCVLTYIFCVESVCATEVTYVTAVRGLVDTQHGLLFGLVGSVSEDMFVLLHSAHSEMRVYTSSVLSLLLFISAVITPEPLTTACLAGTKWTATCCRNTTRVVRRSSLSWCRQASLWCRQSFPRVCFAHAARGRGSVWAAACRSCFLKLL